MSGLGSSLGLAQRKTWLLSHLPLSAQEGVPRCGGARGKAPSVERSQGPLGKP